MPNAHDGAADDWLRAHFLGLRMRPAAFRRPRPIPRPKRAAQSHGRVEGDGTSANHAAKVARFWAAGLRRSAPAGVSLSPVPVTFRESVPCEGTRTYVPHLSRGGVG